MSDQTPLSQDALSKRGFSDEDAYFAEQERITLELLKRERAKKDPSQRCCPNPDCEKQVLEVVEADKVEIDKCPKCGGVWLDAGELELLVNRDKNTKSGLAKFFAHLAGN